jgi:hypothetical protein
MARLADAIVLTIYYEFRYLTAYEDLNSQVQLTFKL